jgi:hypothetical protein
VQDDFAGVPISKQNLSEWRQGGFEEWLARQELWADVHEVEDFARDLNEDKDDVLADDVVTVLAARYAALISRWDGEVDDKFEARARVLNGLCRSVVQLQQGMHQGKREKRQFMEELEEKSRKQQTDCKKRLLDQVWAIQREPIVAKAFGGGEVGRRLAKYVVALQNDDLDAELEITDEDLAKAKRGRKKSKPVKPAPKKRSTKKRTKRKAKRAVKPLKANTLEAEPEPEISDPESSPVKVNQTTSENLCSSELTCGQSPIPPFPIDEVNTRAKNNQL